MKNKLFIFVALCLVVLVTGCAKNNDNIDTLDKISQRGKLVVGVKYDTKPFGYINQNQQLVGYDVDMAKYIAKSILGDENAVEFKQVTPSNRILALNSGEVDMVIATMTITPQRRAVIDFSEPYYMSGQAILIPKRSDITSIRDLNRERVIVIFGTTAEQNLRMLAPDASIIGFKTYTSGYSALKQGRADALTSDDNILLGFAMDDDSVKMLPKRYTREPYGIGFKKSQTSTTLENKVNATITEMRSNGELNRLKAKWIKY